MQLTPSSSSAVPSIAHASASTVASSSIPPLSASSAVSTPPQLRRAPCGRRSICARCVRPIRVCLCPHLPPAPLPNITPLLILQTAAESRAKVRTADILPLVCANARVLRATSTALADVPSDAVLLFPGAGAVALEEAARAGDTLVLIDATWDGAERVLRRSAKLRALRRAFVPERYLGERLFLARKAPTEAVRGARSTAEAAAGALECVGGTEGREGAQAVRRCVHEASEMQLKFVRGEGGGGKHRRDRPGYEEGLYAKKGDGVGLQPL